MLFRASNRSEDYWISVSDLMAGLMILFLFIAISYMVKTQKEDEMYIMIEQEYELAQDAIYNALFDEFEDDLERWDAVINKDNLAFIFLSPDVLFESRKSTLQQEYKEILDDFFPRYIVTLDRVVYPIKMEDKNTGELITVDRRAKDNISAIRIEGHANILAPREYYTQNQKFLYNMTLSSDRAQSVLSYVLNLDLNDQQPWVRDNVRAVGYSSSKPVFNSFNEMDLNRSRRVEFRIVLDAQEKLFELVKKKKEGKLNEVKFLRDNDFLRSQVLDKYRQDLENVKRELTDTESELRDKDMELRSSKQQLSDIMEDIADKKQIAKILDIKISSAQNQVSLLEAQRVRLNVEIDKLKNEKDELTNKIIDLSIDIDRQEERVQVYRELLKTLDNEKLNDKNTDLLNKSVRIGSKLSSDEMDIMNNESQSKKNNNITSSKTGINGLSTNKNETKSLNDVLIRARLVNPPLAPEYPKVAKQVGAEGIVILEFYINKSGKAEDVRVIQSAKGFDKAAILAIERASWVPATVNGVPFREKRQQEIIFNLQN